MTKEKEIIAINLDTSSDNSNSNSDNNTLDSASTSQISTSEEIDYDSPEYKGPPKSLLKCSDDRKGPSKASVPKFEGPLVQGLLDWYGYNTIEEYLSWNYFPSTDKDITDKDITDEDCIHESNYAMSKGQKGKEMCHMEADHVLVKDQNILGLKLLSIAACIYILQLQLTFAGCICIMHLHHAFASCICKQALASKHLNLAFEGCICRLYLHHAFAASICKQALASKHMNLAFASCILRLLTLQQALAATKLTHLLAIATTNVLLICFQLHLAIAAYICRLLTLQQALATTKLTHLLAIETTNVLSICLHLQHLLCFVASYCNKHLHLAFALQLAFSANSSPDECIPHRGSQIVTYILEGALRYKDSNGIIVAEPESIVTKCTNVFEQ
ncbi:hypothetical protein Tco_1124222 [Tanacetum coccineum]|uniref:Uncharacterized protein n=1 Tax=Tanacetum coccineum TaxID=301880 RepID=A0ABQ5J5I1_9ASTR